VDGGAGQDTVLLGDGNDTALETDGGVDGQSGTNLVRVSGGDESEEFTLQAVGTHARIVRDTGGLADLVRVETAEVLVWFGEKAQDSLRVDTKLGNDPHRPRPACPPAAAVRGSVTGPVADDCG
jgi:hypothetical protein